jgi:hypothetical protein
MPIGHNRAPLTVRADLAAAASSWCSSSSSSSSCSQAIAAPATLAMDDQRKAAISQLHNALSVAQSGACGGDTMQQQPSPAMTAGAFSATSICMLQGKQSDGRRSRLRARYEGTQAAKEASKTSVTEPVRTAGTQGNRQLDGGLDPFPEP